MATKKTNPPKAKADSKPRSPKSPPKETSGGKRGGGETAQRRKSQASAMLSNPARRSKMGNPVMQITRTIVDASTPPRVSKNVRFRSLGPKKKK